MNPAIVIPTYWSTGERLGNPGGTYCYDHATPIDKPNPELDGCLASLEQIAGLTHVILLVVAPPAVEERAVHRVHDIAAAHNLPDVVIVDSFKAGFMVDQFQSYMPSNMGEPIGLRGYGAIRNMGLLACCALGCDLAVFIDDDEAVLDPDFLANAAYGIGAKPRSGVPVMVKSGYFLDRRNSALADRRQVASYDKHWAKRQEFNQWMTQALAGPRISRSNTVCGGCFSVHAEAFTRVAFDPWITRGEDLDYMFNLRFYGMDVWFDNRWRVRHNPPRVHDTAFRFLQDVYRWTYERRKIEVGNTHIDLHKLSPDLFMPYPGPWIGAELPGRIKKTALRRAIQTKEHLDYFKIWRNGLNDATEYAEQNCTKYLEFQTYWNAIATDAWRNEGLEHILRAEGMLNAAVAQRMAKRNGVPQKFEQEVARGDQAGPADPAAETPGTAAPSPAAAPAAQSPAAQAPADQTRAFQNPMQPAEKTGPFEQAGRPATQAAAGVAGYAAQGGPGFAPAVAAGPSGASAGFAPVAQAPAPMPADQRAYAAADAAVAAAGVAAFGLAAPGPAVTQAITPADASAGLAPVAQAPAVEPAPAEAPFDYASHGAALAREDGSAVAPADPLLYAIAAPGESVEARPAPADPAADPLVTPARTPEPAHAIDEYVVDPSPVDELEDVAIAFATGSFPAVPQETVSEVPPAATPPAGSEPFVEQAAPVFSAAATTVLPSLSTAMAAVAGAPDGQDRADGPASPDLRAE